MTVTNTVADDTEQVGWTLVVPVKPTELGKSRLAPYIGRRRPDLAHAMALDTMQRALACPAVAEIITVTNDPQIRTALVELSREVGRQIIVVDDEPDAGLNPALIHGVTVSRARHPELGVAAMSADLPALRPDELGRVLEAANGHPNAFVPDAADTGTTIYTARPRSAFTPRFGPGSRWAHRQSGAVELRLSAIASVRRDVDTEPDLVEAIGLGIGHRTRNVLASIGAVL